MLLFLLLLLSSFFLYTFAVVVVVVGFYLNFSFITFTCYFCCFVFLLFGSHNHFNWKKYLQQVSFLDRGQSANKFFFISLWYKVLLLPPSSCSSYSNTSSAFFIGFASFVQNSLHLPLENERRMNRSHLSFKRLAKSSKQGLLSSREDLSFHIASAQDLSPSKQCNTKNKEPNDSWKQWNR